MPGDGQFEYVWDNADRLKEVRKDGQVVMTCRYDGTLGGAGGIGGIPSCSTSATSTVYYHYDANGSVIACTDADGTLVTHLEYSPFGKVMLNSGSYVPRYQVSSKEFDAAVGLNYYGFRYYSPQLGRWQSRDPLGELEGALNSYNFTGNAPAYRVDVDGRSWRSSDSEANLFFGYFNGGGGQVQVTLRGSCCNDKNVKFQFTTVEICGGVGLGGWGGGAGSPIHEDPWGKQSCPPKGVRIYKKVIGAITVNIPGEPGGIVTGEIGDNGTEVDVGVGVGLGAAIVGCVAFTSSSEAGCCE